MRDLLESWTVHLQAERKSPLTIASYKTGVLIYLDWCETEHLPAKPDRAQVRAWIAGLLAGGAAAATASSRLAAVKRFSVWLTEEGEQDSDPLLGIKPPQLDDPLVQPLTDDQIKALVGACKGPLFVDKRDEAIVRFLLETGTRAGELMAIEVADLDVANGLAKIVKGKGGKGRRVSYGPQTARALDRYLRARRGHKLSRTGRVWLGDSGRSFGYGALWVMLNSRAERAGIGRLHPHRLRHTWASRWLGAGGSEGGAMSQGGWAQRRQLDRYSRANAADRSAEEAKRLNLGDI